jgi:hypothetical protein
MALNHNNIIGIISATGRSISLLLTLLLEKPKHPCLIMT